MTNRLVPIASARPDVVGVVAATYWITVRCSSKSIINSLGVSERSLAVGVRPSGV
jgi:hypothetical protein